MSSRHRKAAALVIPAAVAGVLLSSGPASATPSTTTGICSGVMNQLAHRGTVEEDLVRAAARKNADLIASLTEQRTALETQRVGLQTEIDRINRELADLAVKGADLEEGIKTRHDTLAALTFEQAIVAGQVSETEKALAALQIQLSDVQQEVDSLVAQLDELNAEPNAGESAILDLQAKVSAALTQLNQLKGAVSAKKAQLATLQGQLLTLDAQVAEVDGVIRDLEAQLKSNNDAIETLTAEVQDLQDKLGSLQEQIRALDSIIALGGCSA